MTDTIRVFTQDSVIPPLSVQLEERRKLWQDEEHMKFMAQFKRPTCRFVGPGAAKSVEDAVHWSKVLGVPISAARIHMSKTKAHAEAAWQKSANDAGMKLGADSTGAKLGKT